MEDKVQYANIVQYSQTSIMCGTRITTVFNPKIRYSQVQWIIEPAQLQYACSPTGLTKGH